jgi:fucose 4-O-acetylase-like acetyltransferase
MTTPAPTPPEPLPPPARDVALDGAKGALIFLVVLGHTFQFAVLGRHGDPLVDGLFTAIYSFHMPAFMALAGWLAQPGLSRRDGRGRLALRRCLSYLIPILTVTLLTELFWSVQWPAAGLRKSLSDLFWHGLTTLWFCWAMAYGTVILFIAESLRLRLLLAAVLLGAFMLLPAHGHWQLCQSVLPFYVLGYLASAYRGVLQGWRRWLPYVGLAAGVGAVVVVLGFWSREAYVYITGIKWAGPDAHWTLLRYGVGALGCLAFFGLWPWLFSRMPARLAQGLVGWGASSMRTYVLQTLLFNGTTWAGLTLLMLGQAAALKWAVALALAFGIQVLCTLAGQGLAQSPLVAGLLFGTLKAAGGRRSAGGL